ncbi:hypothetical protein B9Z19DRAFT_198080 [Tuber borchii]|uniref:Uncharacterized protein n=1 Tax=Tuber borchii TaxID=42251 RepID=A0A2T6ZNP4_TUBBO|nr:hypothetical protein B9Z19DRAFT_198080 [Tuber borchii]
MQSSPITYRARPSPVGPARHPELPGELRHLRHLQGPPVRPGQSYGRTPRYPSVPGALPGTAVRPVRTRRRTDWTLGFTDLNPMREERIVITAGMAGFGGVRGALTVFATGQSVRPEPGRGRTAFCRPVRSFSQVARQVKIEDEDGQYFVVPSGHFVNLPDK